MSVITRLESMGRRVRTRSEWGTVHESLYQSRRKNKPFALPASYLFAHISVTRDDGPTTPEFDADMRELERIGYERFGSGVSYNWAIDAITGEIGEGQPLDAKGTHTVNDKNAAGFPYNLNLYGHAVVMIGMPGVKPTEEFVKSFAAIRAAEIAESVLRTTSGIYPHSKFAAKECPTAAVVTLLPRIISLSNSIPPKDADVFTDADKKWISAEIRDAVSDYAIWEVLYGIETEDEKEEAREAYRTARAAGKTTVEARAAASSVLSSLREAIKKAQAAG